MSNPLRDYSKGERLEAATVTALTRRARRNPNRGGVPQPNEAPSPTTVLIRNDGGSGEDVERFGILGIDDIVIDRDNNDVQFDNAIVLSGVTPEAASSSSEGHTGKFGIAQQPIAVGDIGRVVISGASQVQIDVTDEDHQFADVKDGDSTQLESAASGAARILYKASGTGTKWAVVNIGGTSQGVDLRVSAGWIQLTVDGGQTWENKIQLYVCVEP